MMNTCPKFYERYMRFMGPFGAVMFYVQAYEIFASRSAGHVSLVGFLIGFIAMASWSLYGILIRNTNVLLGNLTGTIGSFLVILGVWLYGS